MTSRLLDVNSDSSDSEDDCDYVPEEKEGSGASSVEDSCSEDETTTTSPRKGKKPTANGEPHETERTPEEEKKRADELFKHFLEEVEPEARGPVKPDAKVTVTEVYDFAGESVKVTKQVDASSASKSPADAKQPAKRSGGLSSVVGFLSKKKQKMSTLDKSLLDWNSFKKEEGIEEELRNHNKGKSGYIERQAFLQRSDLRQFEIEKNIRLSRRKK